jgi:hypothetical protein
MLRQGQTVYADRTSNPQIISEIALYLRNRDRIARTTAGRFRALVQVREMRGAECLPPEQVAMNDARRTAPYLAAHL